MKLSSLWACLNNHLCGWVGSSSACCHVVAWPLLLTPRANTSAHSLTLQPSQCCSNQTKRRSESGNEAFDRYISSQPERGETPENYLTGFGFSFCAPCHFLPLVSTTLLLLLNSSGCSCRGSQRFTAPHRPRLQTAAIKSLFRLHLLLKNWTHLKKSVIIK